MDHHAPYTGPGTPYTPPRTAAVAQKEIDDLRNVIAHRAEYNITRDVAAPEAKRAAYADGQRAANNAASNFAHDGHGPGEIAVEMITPEVASWRMAAFERTMRAAGLDGEALAAKLSWHRSTMNVVTEN